MNLERSGRPKEDYKRSNHAQYTPFSRKAYQRYDTKSTLIAAFCSERHIQLLMAIFRHSSLPKQPELMRTIICRRGGSPERRERGRTAAPAAVSREARRVVMMMILTGQMPAFSASAYKVQRWTELYPELRPIIFMGLLVPETKP